MADERRWIGNGYGWDKHPRVVTAHTCTCGRRLARVGPITKAGTALLECGTCDKTSHLIGAPA